MKGSDIKPWKITKPIQLVATWFAALIILESLLLTAAVSIGPCWLQTAFGVTAIVIILLFIIAVFLLQTVFRHYTLEDKHYADFLKRREEIFKNFSPENLKKSSKGKPEKEHIKSEEHLEQLRIKKYEENYGLFLVDTVRPSNIEGQVVDIAIALAQHGEGPLKEGLIKSVEYTLGPKFFDHPIRKTNQKNDFRLDVSAYAPMLCLAKVNFTDERPSILLERYIFF